MQRHLYWWQVHRHRIRRQKGNAVRSYILKDKVQDEKRNTQPQLSWFQFMDNCWSSDACKELQSVAVHRLQSGGEGLSCSDEDASWVLLSLLNFRRDAAHSLFLSLVISFDILTFLSNSELLSWSPLRPQMCFFCNWWPTPDGSTPHTSTLVFWGFRSIWWSMSVFATSVTRTVYARCIATVDRIV